MHDNQACTRSHHPAPCCRCANRSAALPDAYYALLSAALPPLQLVKYNIVPSCIGYYSTFRPSMPPVLVVNSVATVGAASSTAVIVSGEQATQFSTTQPFSQGLVS